MPLRLREALSAFTDTPLDVLLGGDATAIEASAQTKVLALFRETAASVPAYRGFLAEHAVDVDSVRSVADFRRVPVVGRKNYLDKYGLPSLARGGRLEACDMVAVSSGSTGEPGFWPRSTADELAIAERFEHVFRDGFRAHQRTTLAVVCFALGTWVGGMFTAAACRHLAAKGYGITVVTPGNVPAEIFRVIAGLAPHFDQTVLLGYPPFLKEVVDQGRAAGIDWAPLALKLVTAGEVFSEEFRSLVAERARIRDVRSDIASLYGTADAGVLGNETPLSVVIRRALWKRPDVAQALFGETRLPTLVQYDPRQRYFEVVDGRLVFSGDNGIPLVRYSIGDAGGIMGYGEMLERLHAAGITPDLGVLPAPLRPLPFVYVFGRSHFAVSFFGANVFPETIAVGLEQPNVAPHVTGKFVLEAKEGLAGDPHLALAIELAKGIDPQAPSITPEAVAESVLAKLLETNSEFAAYTPKQFQTPRVTLHAAGDPAWFPTGVKHRYTRR